MSRRKNAEDFEHNFEGAGILDPLLAIAGSSLDSTEVAQLMLAAKQKGGTPAELIPIFFDTEPHFSSPEVARELYQNLLGLWDGVEAFLAGPAEGSKAEAFERRERPKKPEDPGFFPAQGPDGEHVAAALRYVNADLRARERLMHSFENRQDRLLTWLDEQGLSDPGYALLFRVLFELHAVLELGTGQGPRAVGQEELTGTAGLPPELQAFRAHVEDVVRRAEAAPEHPLAPAEATAVKYWAEQSMGALWQARGRR